MEAGAQWIHGTKGNVAYSIANDMGIIDPESGLLEEIPEILYYENGDLVDEETTEKMWHYYEEVEQLAEEHDAGRLETAGSFFDKAVKQIAGEGRCAAMLRDYLHRELMV